MMMYVIAVKRDKRREMSLGDAVSSLKEIEGVDVLDDPTNKVAVRALISQQAYPKVLKRISAYCHVEQQIEHKFAV